jgi:hypothetical protein
MGEEKQFMNGCQVAVVFFGNPTQSFCGSNIWGECAGFLEWRSRG